MKRPSLGRGSVGGLRETSSLGTLEDVKKVSGCRHLSMGAPFQPRGTWYAGVTYTGHFNG